METSVVGVLSVDVDAELTGCDDVVVTCGAVVHSKGDVVDETNWRKKKITEGFKCPEHFLGTGANGHRI